MSFELKADESLREGVRRMARHQIDNAFEELTRAHKGPRDEAVHETRKTFKKLRALLRLVRPALGRKRYRAENICFRDAARPLTEVRDAKILVETLDALAERFREQIARQAFRDIREGLLANLRTVRSRVLDEQNAFAVTGEVVRQAGTRVGDWSDVADRWSSVGEGLEGTHCRAREAFEDAVADTTVDTLHEWRKQTKYLRYQLEILRPLWPERLEELADEADRLSDLLGDDHDLAVLRQTLTGQPERFGDPGDQEIALALVERRRAELQQEAMLLGQRFFQEGSAKFVRRLKHYWRIWRASRSLQESSASNT